MQLKDHAVIVGAGQAGLVAATTLRAEGFAGRLTLIGAEPTAPYQRPPLSKAFLLGELGDEALLLRPLTAYAAQDIDLRLATAVEAIDIAAGRLQLSDGTKLDFDRLALATGASPRRLPDTMGGSLEGVYSLRTLRDARILSAELIEGRTIVIVGGGYVGLELASTCVARGLTVTVIEAAPRILQRVACHQTSEYLAHVHRARGVQIIEGCELAGLMGGRTVHRVMLKDGRTFAADLVVVAIGIEPSTRLAADAGLGIDGGIAVDAQMRSSSERIWAAGDCAAVTVRGRRLRIESVGNAIDSAEIAARNMLGRGENYRPLPWFWSDQYDTRLQIAGLNVGFDSVHVRHAGAGRSHWYYQSDELLAVDAMNDSRAYMVGKRLLEMGRSPPPEVITNPDADLKALLRS